jgi:ankyrin repeat protein
MPDGTSALMLAVGVGSRTSASRRGIDRIDFGKIEPESRVRQGVAAAVSLGADPNATNTAGDTALHVAASRGYDSVIEWLVERGARVNVQNKRGITPLAAAMFGSTAGRGRAAPAAGADSAGFEAPINVAHPSAVALLKKLGASH